MTTRRRRHKTYPEQPDRRASDAPPPTATTQAYQRLTELSKRRMRIIGAGMLLVSVTLPLVAGIWVELSPTYWGFAGAIAAGGVSLVFPPLGLALLELLPSLVAKLGPASLLGRPDRRKKDS